MSFLELLQSGGVVGKVFKMYKRKDSENFESKAYTIQHLGNFPEDEDLQGLSLLMWYPVYNEKRGGWKWKTEWRSVKEHLEDTCIGRLKQGKIPEPKEFLRYNRRL